MVHYRVELENGKTFNGLVHNKELYLHAKNVQKFFGNSFKNITWINFKK